MNSVENIKKQAAESGFSWKKAEGESIEVCFNRHSYAEAIIRQIPRFEKLTGIRVTYSISPETTYFDELTVKLNCTDGHPDLFMTGAYQIWDYAKSGYIQSLDEFVNDVNLNFPYFDFNDFYSGIISSLRWDLIPGHRIGTGPLWALPLGFESNCLIYNKRIFDERGLRPPETIEELKLLCDRLHEFDGPGTYALALRGARNWGTIHPAYMTTYTNYGAVDFEVVNGKLESQVNSPEAVKMTEDWVDLIRRGGPPNWSSYYWYEAGEDLINGKAAMIFDADILGIVLDSGTAGERENLVWTRAPLPEGNKALRTNLWTWAMAVNQFSEHKLASWLFLQYFTGKDHLKWACSEALCFNPPRTSAFERAQSLNVLSGMEGYTGTFEESVAGTYIQFTPQPHFIETTTEWAETLQDIVAGKYSSVEEGMNHLKREMDEIVSDISVE